jgi:hypothetical protein
MSDITPIILEALKLANLLITKLFEVQKITAEQMKELKKELKDAFEKGDVRRIGRIIQRIRAL